MFRARFVGALGLCLLCLLTSSSEVLAQGCAMCGTAVQNPNDPLARSMASSILFMLSMPFLLFFTVGGWMIFRFRRAGSRRAQQTDESIARGVIAEEKPN